MSSLSLGKAIYCNWHKGPQHDMRCANPTQCYCRCHQPKSLTIRRIKQEITYHQNKIKGLQEALEAKEKWL